MKFRETLKLIEHKGPNQTVILVDPSDCEIFEATQQISHHILIQAEHPCDELMYGRGWMAVQTTCLPKNIWHYVPQWIPTDGAMLEIGNFHGKSLAHFATMIKEMGKNTDCYGIDTYGSINNCAMLASTYMRSIRNVKAMGLESNMHLIPGYSSEICNWFQPESLDFIYIDACHGYRSVVRDIKVSLPLLKKGGIISGHDYVSPMFDGVIQAVNEAFGAKNVQVHKGNVWEYVPPN